MIVEVAVKWMVFCPKGHGRCGEDFDFEPTRGQKRVTYTCRDCLWSPGRGYVPHGVMKMDKPLFLVRMRLAAV